MAFCFANEAYNRFGIGSAYVEVPFGVIYADAVEFDDFAVGIFFAYFFEHLFSIGDLGVDLSGESVTAEWSDKFADLFAGAFDKVCEFNHSESL